MTEKYTPGSHLEIPGLEAILEYGNASKVKRDRIPDAMLINDQSRLDRARITQIDGLHDDPEGSETRQPNPDRHGEGAGNLLYRGRTVGLTGRVEAGNISAMRSNWRRFRGQFGTAEKDLLVHHPFEVGALINEVDNPTFAVDGSRWLTPESTGGGTASALTGGVTDGIMKVGSMTVTGASGAGILRTRGLTLSSVTGLPVTSEWNGEDVWVTVCIKVHSSTGTVTSLAVGIAQRTYVSPGVATTVLSADQALVASPVTGTWYTITVRVPASVIAPTTTHVAPALAVNFSGAGTYTAHFFRCASVLLPTDAPSPAAYFDGDTPGFEWLGAANQSRSVGPTHAENKISDPRFESITINTRLLASWAGLGGAATYDTPPSRSNMWSGDHVEGSLYVKATKILTNSTAWGVVGINSDGNDYYSAVEQRIYRFSAKVNALVKPSGGSFTLAIAWLKESGAVISTNTSEVMGVGESKVSVVMAAPARTCAARVLAQVAGPTNSGDVLEFFLSDPCFVDVTEWNPGDFYGVGDAAEEVGNRRRIPRPFLLQKVRKTSDMKAPEQQSRNRAWRDFTMSLRAADPRVYVLDERREWAQMIGTPKLVFANMDSLVTAATLVGGVPTGGAITTAPTGFTVEGQSGTTGWRYGRQSAFDARSMMTIGDLYTMLAGPPSPGPAATAVQRAYRTVEGYTYTNPRVTIHGHVQMRQPPSNLPVAFAWTGSNNSYNYIGVLLKRVSSSQWIEVRVNSSNNSLFSTFGAVNPPYTVEIWSSHDAAGAAAVTRLAQWDVTLGDPISDPAKYPMKIQAEITTADLISLLITGTHSSGAPITTLSQSYTLPAPLVSLFGSGVAGKSGEVIRSDNWAYASAPAGQSPWYHMVSNYGFPWISYFEVTRADGLQAPYVTCPVIGDVDTPQRIILRGDIDSPILTVYSPDEDGAYTFSTMRLNGIAYENNPVTVDVGSGSIEDASGINRYAMLDSGSLKAFTPGRNVVLATARNWGSYPQHVQVVWRDALR